MPPTSRTPANAWRDRSAERLTLREAAHLYRRAGLGADRATLEAATGQKLGDVVAQLLDVDPQADPQRQRWESMQTVARNGNPVQQLPAWWLYRLMHTRQPGLEKLVLFWHGHFATSAAKVTSPALMLQQNETLRQGAFGPFESLVLAISRDPAMLIYLDSATNRRHHPNENYARELMELFCLGLGNYTEDDIRVLAKAFTGWEVRRDRFEFNRFQHDPAPKRLWGKTFESGEEAVAAVVAHPAASRFIAAKLIRYYVSDAGVAPPQVEALAAQLRENGFSIREALRNLFSSAWFYEAESRAQKIRSPVELALHVLRGLGATSGTLELARTTRELGQSLFFPPNVKGWDGGRQWINTATLVGRMNLVAELLANPETQFGEVDRGDLDRHHGVAAPEDAVAYVHDVWVATEWSASQRAELARSLPSGAARDEPLLVQAVQAAATLPEFQLA